MGEIYIMNIGIDYPAQLCLPVYPAFPLLPAPKAQDVEPSYVIESPQVGLSPTWNPDRCVIPIADDLVAVDMPTAKPKARGAKFIGTKYDLLGFAQGCTIDEIFTRWGDEWARLVHPYGVLYRKTKEIKLKDIV